MEKQEKEVTDLVSKAMAEKAVSQMKRSKRVYSSSPQDPTKYYTIR